MNLVQNFWYILLFSTTTRGFSQRDIFDSDYFDFDETTSRTTTSTATTRICPKDQVQCEPANSKIEFKQCISKNSRRRDEISCLSRTDKEDFFLKPIEKKRRINFNDLLPIEDGAIFCDHGNNQTIGYRLEDLCTYKSFQKCNKLIDDTIITIEIDQWSDFCQDYSYWSNKGECHGRSLKLTKMHESEYDKMDLNTQSTFDINEENRHSILPTESIFCEIFGEIKRKKRSSKSAGYKAGLKEFEYTYARRCSIYESYSNPVGDCSQYNHSFVPENEDAGYRYYCDDDELKGVIDYNFDTSASLPCLNIRRLCLELGKDYYHCPRSETCIKREKLCDGIVHCLNGDDEDFELCSDTFSDGATIKCEEANRGEYSISILATPCDNIKECKNGEDENFCSQLEFIKRTVQIVFICSIFGVWLATYLLARKRNLTQTIKKSHSELNIGYCIGMKGEELVILKNSTDLVTCANLLESRGCFTNIQEFFKIKSQLVQNMLSPFKVIAIYFDHIKDFLVVIQLVLLSGGFYAVGQNWHEFSSVVIFLFFASICIPTLLGGLQLTITSPEMIFGSKRVDSKMYNIFYSILIFLLSPFHATILHVKEYYIHLQLRSNPDDIELNEKRDKLRNCTSKFVKLELGLETGFQFTGQLILFLLTFTETETIGKTEVQKLELNQTLLILSLIGGFIGCLFSYMKGISMNREHFPIMSKIMVLSYAKFAFLTKGSIHKLREQDFGLVLHPPPLL